MTSPEDKSNFEYTSKKALALSGSILGIAAAALLARKELDRRHDMATESTKEETPDENL